MTETLKIYQPTRMAKIKQMETAKGWQEFDVTEMFIQGCKITISTTLENCQNLLQLNLCICSDLAIHT